MLFQLFSALKVNPLAKIMPSAYLCVTFHVKKKKKRRKERIELPKSSYPISGAVQLSHSNRGRLGLT